jgi:hypothetical protein
MTIEHLCDQSGSSGRLVSPGWWKDTDGLVVTRETVDTGLDENETELGVLVLAVALEMLADSDGLHIDISRCARGEEARK